MNQPALPYQTHSRTSFEAAMTKESSAVTERKRVLGYLQYLGADGATDEQIQSDMEISGNTERPRRVELLKLGLIADSGREAKTKSGRMATVWVIKDTP